MRAHPDQSGGRYRSLSSGSGLVIANIGPEFCECRERSSRESKPADFMAGVESFELAVPFIAPNKDRNRTAKKAPGEKLIQMPALAG